MKHEEQEILLFEKDLSHLIDAIDLAFGKYGYRIHFASSLEDVFNSLTNQHIDLVVTSQSMIIMNWLDFMKMVNKLSPVTMVVMLTDQEETSCLSDVLPIARDYFLVEAAAEGKSILLPSKSEEQTLIEKEYIN